MAGGWNRHDGPLPTLGSTVRAHCWLVVTCNAECCRHRPHIYLPPETLAAHAERLGVGMTLLDFRKQLKCSECGGKDIDAIVSGTGPQKVHGAYPPPLAWEAEIVPKPVPPPRSRKARRRTPHIG